jgi:hypothetical protein
MKIYFNGWYSGFLDKTNPVHVGFFIDLFTRVYNEQCEIGSLDESEVLCEFDMLLSCSGTLINNKKWKQTYLFNGESTMKCNSNLYDVVLWGERNYKNVVNVPLFVPYIYANNFVDKLTENKSIVSVPQKDVCVIITNPGGGVRNMFLNELDKNFNVVYAGAYKNNIGQNIPFAYNTPEFLNFICQFKFIISMENSRNDTYITEKIIHGLLTNTVPVYWGSTRVFDYFNNERILCLEDETSINNTINLMKDICNNNDKWLEKVNQPNFVNNKLQRTIDDIAKDIRCLINKGCWNNITHIHCVNNPEFEPDRHTMLKNMFDELNVHSDYVSYISPTYKNTISQEQYNKYTSNQLVRHLRNSNLTYGELSLFLNYRAVLEDIEKKYKDGLFLIFESDAMKSKEINEFNSFLDFIYNKEFDLIHIGMYDTGIFNNIINNAFYTGYRMTNHFTNNDLLDYCRQNTKFSEFIEDITNNNDKFRLVRKFNTRCTDSFIWTYKGISKFLNYMRMFENYSMPFDYFMCNFFENNLNFKHYWSVNEFFKQGSNIGLMKSTLDRNL